MTLPTSNIIAAADYRGIRIVVQSKPSLTYGTEYIASAGERSYLASSISTPAKAMNEAERRIDEAHNHTPEHIALWRNDSEHWLAEQRRAGGAEVVRQEAARMETEARTIDLTPTWAAVARVLIAVLENGTDDGKRLAREELHRMAAVADLAVAAERGR